MFDGKYICHICFIFLLRVAYFLGSFVDCKSIYITPKIQHFRMACSLIFIISSYSLVSLLSCFIGRGSRKRNTEEVQIAWTLNVMLFKNVMCFLSFSSLSMNHPLWFFFFFKFSHWQVNIM